MQSCFSLPSGRHCNHLQLPISLQLPQVAPWLDWVRFCISSGLRGHSGHYFERNNDYWGAGRLGCDCGYQAVLDAMIRKPAVPGRPIRSCAQLTVAPDRGRVRRASRLDGSSLASSVATYQCTCGGRLKVLRYTTRSSNISWHK